MLYSYGKEALGCRVGRDNMPTLCSTYPIARELSWVDFWHDASKELDLVRLPVRLPSAPSSHPLAPPCTASQFGLVCFVFDDPQSFPDSALSAAASVPTPSSGTGPAAGGDEEDAVEGSDPPPVTTLRVDEQVYVTVRTEACEGFFEVR